MTENGRLMKDQWTVLPRGDVAPHWSGLYVSLNRVGSLTMSRVTHERIGAPVAVLIMYDGINGRLALRPAEPGTKNAYPLRKYGRRGGRIIRAFRLLTEFGIRPVDTVEFTQPKIDDEGQLTLDLNLIRISPKAHSQCRNVQHERA